MESKKKFETLALKQILDKVINQKQLKKGVQNIRVCNSWGEVMGKNIVIYTDQVRYSNNILYVKIKSAPLKMELKFKIECVSIGRFKRKLHRCVQNLIPFPNKQSLDPFENN